MDLNGNLEWFDPENIRLTAENSARLGEAKRRRRKPTGEYLKAVPWSWIVAAGKLPGRALVVALIVYHQATMSRTGTAVLRAACWHEFAISRKVVRQALCELERAGLIAVDRQPGKLLRATVKFDF